MNTAFVFKNIYDKLFVFKAASAFYKSFMLPISSLRFFPLTQLTVLENVERIRFNFYLSATT